MAGALALNQWSYLAVVYDGSTVRYFVNGALQSEQPFTAAITARGNPINIGADITPGQFFKGLLDDVRIYNRALTQLQIQTDMVTPSGAPAPNDPNPPQVFIDLPGNNTQVHDIIVVTADASDDAAVAGVQFLIDGVLVGVEDTIDSPFGFTWDTRTVSNGAHTLTALARDVNGNATVSAPVTVNVFNTNYFQTRFLQLALISRPQWHFFPTAQCWWENSGERYGDSRHRFSRPTQLPFCKSPPLVEMLLSRVSMT